MLEKFVLSFFLCLWGFNLQAQVIPELCARMLSGASKDTLSWQASLPSFPVAEKKETKVDKAPDEAEAALYKIEDGIHLKSGLIADEGYKLVFQTCGGCHSLKLVSQNRATKEGWIETIRWMQETQKLWDLGANEEIIVQYLAKNYGIKKKGRRANLSNVEWYAL